VVHLVVAREGDDVPVIFGPSVHAPADGKLAERSFAQEVSVDFELPAELTQRLADLDDFIEREIRPLEQQDDNERFFDHRREYARTDFEHGGVPRAEWEELLAEMFRRPGAARSRAGRGRRPARRRQPALRDAPGVSDRQPGRWSTIRRAIAP
jgi:hypothetical protein